MTIELSLLIAGLGCAFAIFFGLKNNRRADDKEIADRVARDTKINIKSEGKDRYKTNVFVEEGIVLAEIQNKLHEDEEFFLSSNNSVMAVRGTVFGLSVIRGENEIIETYSVYKGVTELVVFDKKDGALINSFLISSIEFLASK